jgi:hypothetical protein
MDTALMQMASTSIQQGHHISPFLSDDFAEVAPYSIP